MKTTTTSPKLAVLLIGEPPALASMAARIEKEYRHVHIEQIRPGRHLLSHGFDRYEYVLCMRADGHTAEVKQLCERGRVRFATLPPSYSAAKATLERIGFQGSVRAAVSGGGVLVPVPARVTGTTMAAAFDAARNKIPIVEAFLKDTAPTPPPKPTAPAPEKAQKEQTAPMATPSKKPDIITVSDHGKSREIDLAQESWIQGAETFMRGDLNLQGEAMVAVLWSMFKTNTGLLKTEFRCVVLALRRRLRAAAGMSEAGGRRDRRPKPVQAAVVVSGTTAVVPPAPLPAPPPVAVIPAPAAPEVNADQAMADFRAACQMVADAMGPAGVSMVTINAPAAPGLKAAVSIKKVTVTADTFEV